MSGGGASAWRSAPRPSPSSRVDISRNECGRRLLRCRLAILSDGGSEAQQGRALPSVEPHLLSPAAPLHTPRRQGAARSAAVRTYLLGSAQARRKGGGGCAAAHVCQQRLLARRDMRSAPRHSSPPWEALSSHLSSRVAAVRDAAFAGADRSPQPLGEEHSLPRPLGEGRGAGLASVLPAPPLVPARGALRYGEAAYRSSKSRVWRRRLSSSAPRKDIYFFSHPSSVFIAFSEGH